MVIWGAIWGLILGFLWPGHGLNWQAAVGVIAGAIAGYSLRSVVRVEIESQGCNWSDGKDFGGTFPSKRKM